MNVSKILQQINSWSELRKAVHHSDNKTKGDTFEELTYYYLRIQPEYATKLSHIWRLKDVPSSVHEMLNLPFADEGIDLIAKTKEDEYWAIQCKYREDESRPINRKELSTFTDLAFGVCRNISLALVCTTADRYSHKLTFYENRLALCPGNVWRELDPEFFRILHETIKGKFTPPNPLSPRPHQLSAIANACEHFETDRNPRGKMIMPCGTGKSLTAYWISERLTARTILVAVPSLSLIQQTLRCYSREALAHQKDIRWICICSDATVGSIEKDDPAVLTHDLGVRVHTDPDEIAGWLQKRHSGITVIIATYQSGKAVSEAVAKARMTIDLGIMDEAHKTVGKKESLFSHLLFDENIKIRHRLFMTATERRYIGASDQIAGMDDFHLYGDTFELLSFKAALEYDPPILSDYRIVTIFVTRSEIAGLIKENLYVKPDKGKWDEEIEAGMLAAAIVLRKAMERRPIRHAISFHSSIARAKSFQATQDIITASFPDYGPLETFHVSGDIPTARRKKTIDQFEKAPRGLITNARCLTEGVDVPNIDCILFADPRKSAVDIVQAVGRALRPEANKKMGYVIIPVIVDDDFDMEKAFESKTFGPLLQTLRALAANDDRIIEYFRSVSKRKNRQGNGPSVFETANLS